MRAAIASLSAILGLAACGFMVEVNPAAVCAEQARAYGPEFEVVGAFESTVGSVRTMTPEEMPERWPELADEASAVVCYLDGPVAKAFPGGGEPFDRAVVAVAGERAELIMAGHRARLPVRSP